MVSYYPHWVASRGRCETGNRARRGDEGLATKVLNQVRQAFCAMHGHDALLQFEHKRMFLRCVSCGHESAGWTIDNTAPTGTVRDDARRSSLSPQHVGVRRIA